MLQIMEEESAQGVENALAKLARDGNAAAREVLIQRDKGDLLEDEEEKEKEEKKKSNQSRDNNMSEDGEDKDMGERRDQSRSTPSPGEGEDKYCHERRRSRSRSYDRYDDERDRDRDRRKKKKKDKDRSDRKKDKKKKKEKSYGSLFKSTKESTTAPTHSSGPTKPSDTNVGGSGGVEEGSEEYWNAERAKLGLAPLKK